ncbi:MULTISPECIES: hypothetical protein [unclassified Brucella]|nr:MULTISPECIES: hypothetical protein [unclassified Brucella]MRN44801.1 hypothetical protein [Brucella sp. 09RB8913]MRN60369.1 hypothetical protein [Brucella sp. 09RB8918]CAB4325006.1 hypothetical protein BCH_00225 [Brucella sp. 191011898]
MPTIEELEDEERFTDDHNENPPSDIVAYNELKVGMVLRIMRKAIQD